MDGHKLDISGKTASDPPTALYKPIPEKDMEEEAITRPKSLIAIKEKTSPDDGADEKMLPNDDKVPEVVVFDEKSPQNGDAKLDIEDIKNGFVGLTKEELMKYANDPFWIRLRWFLFVTFWVLWAGMLLGAVLIIYAAPKCDPPPPRTWWQQGPLAELKPNTTPETLKLLDKDVQGVIISWPKDTYDFDESHDVFNFIRTAKEQGTNVIIELEPAVSDVWFKKSENKDPSFDGYYIWNAGNFKGGDTEPSPPNNWISQNNVSSWKYSQTRREFYYSPFDKPHLNFRNKSVVEEFNKIIDKFLAANVTGIRLRKAAYLLVDSSLEDEPLNNMQKGLDHTKYGFYVHSKTEYLTDLGPLMKEWRKIVRNKTETGPFMVAEELIKVEPFKVNGTLVVDLPLQSHVFSKPTFSVNETANTLNYTFNIDMIEWPLWEASTPALPQDVLQIMTHLLPGSPLVNVSQPLNKVLIKIRQSPSIMRGMCAVYNLKNNTVLAFIRMISGSPGILVAVNPSDESSTVDLSAEIPPLENVHEVTVRLYSTNYNETSFMDIGAKREASAIPVSPKSAIVLEYVPKKDE